MKMYMCCVGIAKIEPVEVERETKNYVVINGKRDYAIGHYFHSWEGAHAFLLEEAEAACQSYRVQLAKLNGHLDNVKGMKKPEGN